MPLVERDDVLQALAPPCADPALFHGVGLGGPHRRQDRPGPKPLSHALATVLAARLLQERG